MNKKLQKQTPIMKKPQTHPDRDTAIRAEKQKTDLAVATREEKQKSDLAAAMRAGFLPVCVGKETHRNPLVF